MYFVALFVHSNAITMKKITALIALTLISACSTSVHKTPSTTDTYNYVDIWQSSPTLTPSDEAFGRAFEDTLTFISTQADARTVDWTALNNALYFLRAYSYKGDLDAIKESQLVALSSQLQALIERVEDAPKAQQQRFLEHYAVTLYRLLDTPELYDEAPQWLENTLNTIAKEQTQASLEGDYALWESYRALGFLAFSARDNEQLAQSISSDARLRQVLLKSIARGDWQQAHALWVLGYVHQLLAQEQQQLLDTQVWQALTKAESDKTQQQTLFSSIYLVNSFRGKSSCHDTFKGQCLEIDIDQALPINHECSERLFIRATSLDAEQLAYSCNRLTAQEEDFHTLLDTQYQPVANDHNQALRVVIFDQYADYNRYGQLLFDINTNNGGMYIEGTPSDPNNQATFYTFRAFWLEDANKVWNLNHEYVHYLDGRFNKYGGFGHFPAQLVWWSEGLAELVAKGKHNPKAYKAIAETPTSERPTLTEIFDTSYADSSRQIYQWSYLAIRYLAEQDLNGLRQLQQHLKGDFYQGYADTLAQLAAQHEDGFTAFLDNYPATEENAEDKAKHKINKLYRYLYRDYLMPKHLSYDEQHRHLF